MAEKRKIVIEDTVYETEVTKKYIDSLDYEFKIENNIKAFLPGFIASIKVSEGDIVKAGTPIMILEAMKMLNEIILKNDVKILKIEVKEGDIVSKNQILVEYLPA